MVRACNDRTAWQRGRSIHGEAFRSSLVKGRALVDGRWWRDRQYSQSTHQQLAMLARLGPLYWQAALAAETVMREAPQTIHKTRDVFGITRGLPLNYVTRIDVDSKFIDSLTREKHLIIHGGSKQGKTSLRKYNLKPDDYIGISCQNKWEVADLMAAILKAAGYQVTQSDS